MTCNSNSWSRSSGEREEEEEVRSQEEEEAKGFVDNAKLVPLLWEAGKELAAETRRLTATVEQLTQQLDMTAPAALRMTAEYHSLM